MRPADAAACAAERHLERLCVGCGREPYPEHHQGGAPWMCAACGRAVVGGAGRVLDAAAAAAGVGDDERAALGTIARAILRRL